MSYWSGWKDVNTASVRKFRWKSEEEPNGYRDSGKLLVYYDDTEVLYEPISYGWWILLDSIDDTTTICVLSGVTCNGDPESQLLQQLSDVMNLDRLEETLLLRLHAVFYNSYIDYGCISEIDYNPVTSCTLLAFLIENYRGRDRTDSWKRAAATHKDATKSKIQDTYQNMTQQRSESMEKIVQFTSTTTQEELPDRLINN